MVPHPPYRLPLVPLIEFTQPPLLKHILGVPLHRQTSTFMEDFADEEEYVRRRLSDLQVSLDLVDTDIFRMKNRGGFTRRVRQFTQFIVIGL